MRFSHARLRPLDALMVALVTGGAGYVGSHTVVALCDAGHEVVILDDFSGAHRRTVDTIRSLTRQAVPVVEADAADSAALADVFGRWTIDSVIHFAALKSAPESVGDPLRYYHANLMSLISLAEASLHHSVSRFVFSSSAAVYGSPSSLPVTENTPTAPLNPYGASKQMCERILADMSAASGLSTVTLRYFNPVGAHRSALLGEDPLGPPANLVPRIVQTMLGGDRPLQVFGSDYDTRDGTAIRDYVHVMDLAEAHCAALNVDMRDRSSRVYNLGTGNGSTVLEVLAAAERAAGRAVPHEFRERRTGDSPALWADCTRALNELNWKPRRNLQQMLDDQWRFACANLADRAR